MPRCASLPDPQEGGRPGQDRPEGRPDTGPASSGRRTHFRVGSRIGTGGDAGPVSSSGRPEDA